MNDPTDDVDCFRSTDTIGIRGETFPSVIRGENHTWRFEVNITEEDSPIAVIYYPNAMTDNHHYETPAETAFIEETDEGWILEWWDAENEIHNEDKNRFTVDEKTINECDTLKDAVSLLRDGGFRA